MALYRALRYPRDLVDRLLAKHRGRAGAK